MTTSLTPGRILAEVFELELALIDRDPEQPRFLENVDTDLASSFQAHGWFPDEPLRVRVHPVIPDRFMLMNGERRFAGAKAAGLKKGLAVLVDEAEIEAEPFTRLAQQLQSNEGKPLTYLERAAAIKRLLDGRRAELEAKKKGAGAAYGVTQLAKDIGLPKSTVGDALSLFDIPAFWHPLIADGPLGPAAVPELRKWAAVPEKFQKRGFEQMKADYRWDQRGAKTERIHVDVLETLLRTFFRKFIRPIGDVPGYKGPTQRMSIGYGGLKTYAMDPSQWQPIWRKKIAAKAKKTRSGEADGQREAESWEEQNRKAREKQLRREAIFDKAEPVIVRAIIDGVKAAPAAALVGKGALAELLLAHVCRQRDADAAFEKADTSTPEAFLRTLAAMVLCDHVDVWNSSRLPQTLAQAGLKIDVKQILEDAETAIDEEAEKPEPAKADTKKKGAKK